MKAHKRDLISGTQKPDIYCLFLFLLDSLLRGLDGVCCPNHFDLEILETFYGSIVDLSAAMIHAIFTSFL